jgi:hypothetical protein
MNKSTATLPSDRSEQQIEWNKERLREMLPDGGTLYYMNHGTGYTPKLTLFVVHEGRIERVTSMAAFVGGWRWHNGHGWIHSFRPGGGAGQHVADTLAQRLGYAKITATEL